MNKVCTAKIYDWWELQSNQSEDNCFCEVGRAVI